MSEIMISLYEFFQENWAKLLLIITTPIVGGISIWQLLMFFVNLVKNNTAKKYFKPLSAKYDEIKTEFEKMQDSFKEMIAEFKAENTNNIKTVIANFVASYENTKKQIYQDIINNDDNLACQIADSKETVVELDHDESLLKEENNIVQDLEIDDKVVNVVPLEDNKTEKSIDNGEIL